jgi:hypothetical protein
MYKIQQALQGMKSIGGICETLALTLDSLVAAKHLKLYTPGVTPTAYTGGGASSAGAYGGRGWIVLSTFWTDHWYGSTFERNIADGGIEVKRNLQYALAHEADHVRGQGPHNDPTSKYLTNNSVACSGL